MTAGETDERTDSTDRTPSDSERGAETLVGKVLDNKFEILSLLGKGGMSVVYKARHRLMEKVVAVKTLLPHLVQNSQSLLRFKQEAKAAASLSHPNIIAIHEFDISPDQIAYLVMDFIDGHSLSELIHKEGFLDAERAIPIFIQITSALTQAHDKGIIHRDLKPSNIMLVENEGYAHFVKVMDFGLAKLVQDDGSPGANLTKTGEVFGSPLQMSPEQCRGEKLDARTDIYALGCIMYETLTGVPPFTGANTPEILLKHVSEIPRPLKTANPKARVPVQLEAIIFRALTKDPSQRYQSMSALRAAIETVQPEQNRSFTSQISASMELARLKKRPIRTSERVAMAAVTILVLGALALFLSMRMHDTRPPFFMLKFAANIKSQPPQPSESEQKQLAEAAVRDDKLLTLLDGPCKTVIDSLVKAGYSRRDPRFDFEGNVQDAQELPKARQVQKVIELLLHDADLYVRFGQNEPALKICQQVRKALAAGFEYPVWTQHMNVHTLADSLGLVFGDYWYNKGDYRQALGCYAMAHSRLTAPGKTLEFANNRSYMERQEYIEALTHATLRLADCQYLTARKEEEFDSAGKLYNWLLEPSNGLVDPQPDVYQSALYRSRLGDSQRIGNDCVQAANSYAQAVRQWPSLNDPKNLAICMADLAISRCKCVEHYLERRKRALDRGQNDLANTEQNYAQHEESSAIETFSRALPLIEEQFGNNDPQVKIFRQHYAYFVWDHGDWLKSLEMLLNPTSTK